MRVPLFSFKQQFCLQEPPRSKSSCAPFAPLRFAVQVALLQSLFTQFPGIDFKDKIGVLTPYQSQLRELRRHYELSLTKTQQLCIESNTVDAFQGREKEIIIFSCVRAGAQRGIGFVADTRRMNVALTRAKHAIWVVGNAKSLSRNQDWRSYIGCVAFQSVGILVLS